MRTRRSEWRGGHFDVRKHLLEYDDVLNTQRERIYAQRDRIFEKEDLREDVTEMFRNELQNRIDANLNEDEQHWRLLAYLNQLQPAINYAGVVYPSYSQKILIDSLGDFESPESLRRKLLNLAAKALDAWRAHSEETLEKQFQRSYESFNVRVGEILEGLDVIFDTLDLSQPDAKEQLTQRIARSFGVRLSPSDPLWERI